MGITRLCPTLLTALVMASPAVGATDATDGSALVVEGQTTQNVGRVGEDPRPIVLLVVSDESPITQATATVRLVAGPGQPDPSKFHADLLSRKISTLGSRLDVRADRGAMPTPGRYEIRLALSGSTQPKADEKSVLVTKRVAVTMIRDAIASGDMSPPSRSA